MRVRPFFLAVPTALVAAAGFAWLTSAAASNGGFDQAPQIAQAAPPAAAPPAAGGGPAATGAAATKPLLPPDLVRTLARRHGTGLDDLLDGVRTVSDLGQAFGGHLYEAEVRYLMREEWAVEPDDVLWRRTKEGLHMTGTERSDFARWMQSLRLNA